MTLKDSDFAGYANNPALLQKFPFLKAAFEQAAQKAAADADCPPCARKSRAAAAGLAALKAAAAQMGPATLAEFKAAVGCPPGEGLKFFVRGAGGKSTKVMI